MEITPKIRAVLNLLSRTSGLGQSCVFDSFGKTGSFDSIINGCEDDCRPMCFKWSLYAIHRYSNLQALDIEAEYNRTKSIDAVFAFANP
jgi:hypothetical protein